ncbi:glycoside hydrolase family 18 protein [Mucilaginibacter sp. RS28]|uniref:chitinase n=1 Tax=Mucilaginibacter straminoryzae TaxID=2932774 RepID=A0A9X1X926_9SPHI|nr:glycoside hydrolase family 18 protein [Mucilaginibacter straminoryzae]MCJ8211978.1 glycoside hydrolase family 18 protein [Mucilaginibacter straminoryzae]
MKFPRATRSGYSIAAAIICFVLLSAMTNIRRHAAPKPKPVIIGYVGGFRGLIDTNLVDARKLTHINYAFVDIKNNRAFLHYERTDTANFSMLRKLKKVNPDLKILISIGGWAWSGRFSDAMLSDTARTAFAASAVDIIRKYQLDGVDIDWEYPNDIGAGNVFRPEDKHTYTLMFHDLRKELDQLEHETGKKLLLTAAVGGFKRFLQNTEMGQVQRYLNYVNLMTYDYFQDSLKIAVHHTNLYASRKYQTRDDADKAVNDFMEAGVPVEKLVMGLAFYGRSAKVRDAINYGLGDTTAGRMPGRGFTFIKDSLLTNKDFKYYRDQDAKAPYLFNAATKQFISYDDEWSVKAKCNYVLKKHMAGVMFWEYADDKKTYLLNEVNRDLK